jgi:hypothetical protein
LHKRDIIAIVKVTPQLLERVARDNIRDNQIGDIEGGISWEVAHDLGYMTVAEAAALIPVVEDETSATHRRPTIAQQNANERLAIARHKAIRRQAQRINFDRHLTD